MDQRETFRRFSVSLRWNIQLLMQNRTHEGDVRGAGVFQWFLKYSCVCFTGQWRNRRHTGEERQRHGAFSNNPSWHGHGDSWQVCDHQRHLWGAAGGDNQESTWSAGYYGYLNSLCVAAHWRRNVLFKRGVDFGSYFWELFVWICCFLAPLTYERIQPHNLVCLLIYRWIVFKRLSN